MAATSLSTPAPNPRNPEETSNSVRPERVEGPNGRSGFDELSPNGILNRRTLLASAGTLALAAPVITFGHPHPPRLAALLPLPSRERALTERAGPAPSPLEGEGWGEGAKKEDPAVLAYAWVLEADEATWAVEADEDDPVYRGLCDAYDRAEATFAATRATTPEGVRAKLDRIAYRCQWEPERAFHDCPLVPSIVADFAHILREIR